MAIFNRGDVRNIFRIGDAISKDKLLIREPQKTYQFEVWVHDVSGASATSFGDLLLYVKTVDIPPQTKDPIQYDFMDHKIFYSGKDSSAHTCNVTFWDDQSLIVMDYFHNWFQLTGTHKYQEKVDKVNYIKRIEIRLKDATDLVTVGKIILHNAFPIEIGSTQLSYDNSEIIELPITFAYDYMEFGDFNADVLNRIEDVADFLGNPIDFL